MTGVLTTFLVVSLTLLACVVNGINNNIFIVRKSIVGLLWSRLFVSNLEFSGQLGLNTTVLCSEVACSDGWICQNACSSWCGVSEPTEARPVCNPKTGTRIL